MQTDLTFHLHQAHIGIKGLVRDVNGNPIEGAVIRVQNVTAGTGSVINHDVTTSEFLKYGPS